MFLICYSYFPLQVSLFSHGSIFQAMISHRMCYLRIGLKCSLHLNFCIIYAQWSQEKSSIENQELSVVFDCDSFNCLRFVMLVESELWSISKN